MLGDVEYTRAGLCTYPEWIRQETEGLTLEEMFYAAQEPAWARWCIELQIRHIATGPFSWLYRRCGHLLRPRGYVFPSDTDALDLFLKDGVRHVPPEVAPHREAVLGMIRRWSDFAVTVLDGESPDNLRALAFDRTVDPEMRHPRDPRRFIEYARATASIHPEGYVEDPERPGHFRVELGAVLLHIYWGALAHTRTIQRLKGLFGRPPAVELPREGYLSLPEFYD